MSQVPSNHEFKVTKVIWAVIGAVIFGGLISVSESMGVNFPAIVTVKSAVIAGGLLGYMVG